MESLRADLPRLLDLVGEPMSEDVSRAHARQPRRATSSAHGAVPGLLRAPDCANWWPNAMRRSSSVSATASVTDRRQLTAASATSPRAVATRAVTAASLRRHLSSAGGVSVCRDGGSGAATRCASARVEFESRRNHRRRAGPPPGPARNSSYATTAQRSRGRTSRSSMMIVLVRSH